MGWFDKLPRIMIAIATCSGCGSSSPPPVVAPPPPPVATIESEEAHRSKITAAHHALEDEQISAFAATCETPGPKRCMPSCYVGAPIDPHAGKTPAEIVHTVCAPADAGPFSIVDELGGIASGRTPAAAKKGTWQAAVESAVIAALKPALARGDAVRVLGTWRALVNPVTAEHLRCVTVVQYARPARALDGCGGHGEIACEAGGNAAAHGIDVVHFRLAEAQKLHAAHDDAGCQKAALEAFAVARGLPRWRQYATLNTNTWKSFARYRTRFDGILDEDTLFTTAAALGTDAEAAYAACGGATPKTTAAQEQSFHMCW